MRHLKRFGLALASCLVLTACGMGITSSPQETDARLALYVSPCDSPAPLKLHAGEKVPDSYIIVFDEDLDDPFARIEQLERKHGFTASSRWEAALKGFAATLSPETVGSLRCEDDVDYINENGYVQVD
ncbi:protease inhibitor I9 family protein [Hyalangium rubrum]|uniref:Inhibitor I9 domain-containing protein n=1 Tax=Hyalangium rubrum TaxID=3103134 RepID=A0ABU5H7S4_9BACT|nr:protease inhibitor I9 family protein [Hyalangium sp. s54d21]MDY7229361.1 hypothetical protein [Hyalangium sp. s54d21]